MAPVDVTFIEAPTSTKNASCKRDPEMHQAKKGNNWHFGMKAHIGTDAESGLVHGEEDAGFGDAGYTGVEKCEDTQHIRATWHVA